MFRRTSASIAALVLGAGLTGVAEAEPDLTPTLPAPTGRHQVGVTALHLVDADRPDPWPDAAGRPREVLVSVRYPALDVRGHPVAPQLTPGVAATLPLVRPWVYPNLPPSGVAWGATPTHSHVDAPARPVRRPVVLYSPGLVDPAAFGTNTAEELASRGYVVVSIDHPGEAFAVDLPGGPRPIALPGRPDADPALYRTVIATRLADTAFVLDRLEVLAAGGNPDAGGRPLPANLGRALDLRRVGMYGQGLGGTIAAEGMHEDRRIDAAINMEGFLDYHPDQPGQDGELLPVAQQGVDRPLLLLGTEGFQNDRYRRAWSAVLAHGCARQHVIADANHWALTDFAAVAPQLHAAGLMDDAELAAMVGTLPPSTSVPTVRRQVVSFFDRHLR
ncbi:alpha/beta hydrolase [Saccharothrix sp. S26]|uniref:alpha/beta hydrolase n=1 Tax=Saccharothrix sp. S26 TaxID=2907215 RepID=UPI001F2C10CA|nr:alpha/beta hydrolase [Saccharothrix sp. S26]MCE6994718.1 alpha/beta hydrolase [Saccharothrix sp. S26]